MDLSFKFDIHIACKKIIQDELEKIGVDYIFHSASEVKLKNEPDPKTLAHLCSRLEEYGIYFIGDQKDSLVQKIKSTIIQLVYDDDTMPHVTTSVYLSSKLGFSYGYLSNLFSEMTLTTIENFIILQKIERAKQLLSTGDNTLTEIAYKLNYSSVAHLSNQFRKTTGLTPSTFQRILLKRKEVNGLKSYEPVSRDQAPRIKQADSSL